MSAQPTEIFKYGLKLGSDTLRNRKYRIELASTTWQQIAAMCLKNGEKVPAEIHTVDQFIYTVSGIGYAIVGDQITTVEAGDAILVPAGVKHEIGNNGYDVFKFFTLYSPPEEE